MKINQTTFRLLERFEYTIQINIVKFSKIMFILLVVFFPNLFAKDDSTCVQQKPHINLQEAEISGTLWGWGANYYGQLGDGTVTYRYEPIRIGKEHNWKMVSCSAYNTIALKSDGTLWAWGLGASGSLGDGTTFDRHIPVQIGKDNNWKYISAGGTHSLAIKDDGSVWAWGLNTLGELGDSTNIHTTAPTKILNKNMKDIVFVNADDHHSIAIKSDGTLWVWGGEKLYRRYPNQIGLSNEWVYATNKYAIKKNGTLWNYSSITEKQIGFDSNWVLISENGDYSHAIKSNGTLWAWGKNHNYQLGDGTTDTRNNPIQIGTDSDWVKVINSTHNVGLKGDSTLWVWGVFKYNESVDSIFGYTIPTKLSKFTKVLAIPTSNCGLGHGHTLFIRKYDPKLPEVITLPVKNINSYSAEGWGKVISDGEDDYVYRGVCYSRMPNPTIKNDIVQSGTDIGEYQSMMEGLKPYTKYYVRAYATNTVGTAYGQEETFITKLEVPRLISPKNNTNNLQTSISLIWEKVDFAQNYRLQLSKSSTFDSLLADETTDKLNIDYSKYELNSVYFWCVQSINGSDSSDWSEQWAFTTAKFYPAQLLKPGNDTINIPIECELSWKENIAGCKYNLQFSKNNNFTKPDIDTTLSSTKLQIKNLDFLHFYYWRVRAKEGTDQSEWSPIWKFTTLMDSVNLTSPIDLSKNINFPAAMSWKEGIYKKDYRLQISETDDFATTNTDTLITKINNADVKNLNYWQKYFWRVRNESGDTLGYWSQIWQFKTRLSDMLLIYPEDTQTGLEQEINFKWYPVIGAEYYQLQISKNDNFTDLVYSKDSITTTEKFVPALEKDILYYWRVRVWNTETIGTAYWSEVWTFTTGGNGVKDESEMIQIIPNPAGDYITIALKPSEGFEPSEGSEILIYNTLGEMMLSESIHPMTASHRMNIGSLPKGMYFVKVGGETKKFVKL